MPVDVRVDLPDMDKLSDGLRLRVMGQAVDIVKKHTHELVPVGKTHNLANSIRGGVGQRGAVGVVKAGASHAWLVTHGTSAHSLKPVKAHALAIQSAGHVVMRATAEHPGSKPNPFLIKALQESAGELDAILGSKGEQLIAKAIADAK
jgi:hypothetical protein